MEIYLAGAMGCYEETNLEAYEWRNKATERFKEFSDDCYCVNPMDYYVYNDNYSKTPSEIMRFDLRKIKKSDVVLVNLKDLDKSIGTSDEILYAYLNGIPIIGFIETNKTLSETEIQKIIHQWKYEQIDRIETGKDAMLCAIWYIISYLK